VENGHQEIRITCEISTTLTLGRMTELQGELKARTSEDYDKIMRSIYKYGIAFPFFVWKKGRLNYILDGHGRTGALIRERERGVKIPALPVVYVQAADEQTAKNLLLRLNSRYGEITIEGIRDFLEGVDIDLDEINIPEIPDLTERLDALLEDATDGGHNNPEFILFCPECGEQYHVTDDELREVAGYES